MPLSVRFLLMPVCQLLRSSREHSGDVLNYTQMSVNIYFLSNTAPQLQVETIVSRNPTILGKHIDGQMFRASLIKLKIKRLLLKRNVNRRKPER